ncbi:MAG: glutaredoxin family protein [Chloroflexota bacterium]
MRRRRKHVTLYGKPGCHLCEDARALLERLQRRFPMDILEIDITTDPKLFRTYDVRIPVIDVESSSSVEAPIDEAALRRALSQ